MTLRDIRWWLIRKLVRHDSCAINLLSLGLTLKVNPGTQFLADVWVVDAEHWDDAYKKFRRIEIHQDLTWEALKDAPMPEFSRSSSARYVDKDGVERVGDFNVRFNVKDGGTKRETDND